MDQKRLRLDETKKQILIKALIGMAKTMDPNMARFYYMMIENIETMPCDRIFLNMPVETDCAVHAMKRFPGSPEVMDILDQLVLTRKAYAQRKECNYNHGNLPVQSGRDQL